MTSAPVLTPNELTLWIGALQVCFGVAALVLAGRLGRERVGFATAPLGAMFLITGLLKLLNDRIADAILFPAAGLAFAIAVGVFVRNIRASRVRRV
jgi:hypothetical protein